MALFRKPHTLTLSEASEVIGGDSIVETTDHEVTAVTVLGQLTPESSASAFERYGVETSRPHLFMFEIADVGKVAVGNRFVLGEREFVVRTPVQIWNAETRTAHATAILEELD